jgi:uncharacterized protein YjbI with pentapeptide repeats
MKQEKNNPPECSICGRPTHKKSEYCIFHASAEEKTEEEFKTALKEYIKEIEKENTGYNFKEFIFIGHIDFTNMIFKNNYVSFWGANFEGDANFPGAVFIGCSIFFDSTFNGNVEFIGTDFQGYADFREATFNGNVNFYHATFEGDAYFEKTTFKRYVDFTKVNFLRLNNFLWATFEEGICFDNATLSQGEKLILKGKNRGNISFKHAFLENVFLRLDLDDGVLVDFSDALIRNTKIKKEHIEKHILQEKNKSFDEAKEIYLLLKNNFHSIGRYEDESWAFKKEKDMERKSYYFNAFTRNIESKEEKKEEKDQQVKKSKVILYSNWMKAKEFGKWLWSCFCNAIYGYGEKPQNVIISAIIIILLFSAFFSILGINSPEIIEMKSPTLQEIFNGDSEIVSKGILISKTTNYSIDCIYFSAITFTTLGYGDFRPLEGWGRILAGSEAFIGAFMMALFVYTFARRTGGR